MSDAAAQVSPAKINLLLAVTGRRADGYHDLVSVAVPLVWGDELAAAPAGDGETRLDCDDPAVPTGADNLIVKAAAAFREATGWRGGVRFTLRKRIPMGAGLGGGSGNAAVALLQLNGRLARPLAREELMGVAARVGSDCALFLGGGAVVMRGRGERIEPLAAAARGRIAGRRLFVFKPDFGVPTVWAYRRLAEMGAYTPAAVAERRVAEWSADPAAPLERLLLNTLETPVDGKFPALPALRERLRKAFGLEPMMSGSGSACFALVPSDGGPPAAEVAAVVREAWGRSSWFLETALAG